LMQSAGSALRISTSSLRKIMGSSQSFTSTLLNYVHTFMVQASQTALANGRARLDERLARWMLMWHDRTRDNELLITHELLALLLGVRRAGVTVAMHELEGRGLIRSSRGRIRIVDRIGLELAASGFYGVPEYEYERSIGFASAKPSHRVLSVAYGSGEVLLPAQDGSRRRRRRAPAKNKC
jgi:DNA-binding transcriptional MocR family regulator